MKRSALLAIICLAACDEADVPLDQCSHAAAYERAKTEMTNLLKSPGSAIYPAASKPGFISDAGVIVTKRAEPCTFGISSHVDSTKRIWRFDQNQIQHNARMEGGAK